jgi:hypothetical protein
MRRRRVRRNAGNRRYLIQGLRPRHRHWVTIDEEDNEERALLNALHRARLGDVAYRVWDTHLVKELWQGRGRDAKIAPWQTRRPSGLVGANRRKAMLRNPVLSKRMLPLRENTMRLGDVMKWGRRLLDAGVGIHVWDGSGWEVDFKPDDAYSTPSGRAATGGRRYLAQGAGLIKTWPITLIAPRVAPGMWLTGAHIGHFLAHRKSGVASNPRACTNPLCRVSARRNNGARPHYEIKASDVGKRYITAFGRIWYIQSLMGHIMSRDVGKRIYEVRGVLQVENDEQLSRRLGGGARPNVLIRGDRLPHNLQLAVLRRFIYRWTSDNSDRARVYHCPVCNVPGGDPNGGVACRQYHPTMPLITDHQWLKEHAFHVTKDGARLMENRRHAEPASLADRNPGRTMSKRREPYCRMCGKDRPKDGPFRRPKVGPSKGKIICDLCYRGWRSGRRSGEKWARNRRSVRRNSGTVSENVRIQHEQIVEAFLAGRPKKVGPRYWTDGTLLRVWGNLVAKRDPTGVELYDAGYRTLLTKNILNTVLRHLGQGTIFQKARTWYITTTQGDKTWPGNWTVLTGGAAANRRRVAPNGRGENLTVADIEQWVNNDEGLYRWWKSSRMSLRAFVRDNRAELERVIQAALNRPPQQKTWRDYAGTNPRIRAWNIVAYIPGKPERWTMQSGIKDKKRAEDTARVYRDIAKRERRRHRYVVQPFRYSDTASRMKARRNPTSNAWNVYLNGKLIDTVFYSAGAKVTADEVKRSLVNHDGYDPGIVVRRSNRFGKKNPLTARESARLIRKARSFMGSAKDEFTSRGRHYRYGQASGVAAAVQLAGPRRAEIPASMIRGRAMKAHRLSANPRRVRHAGLNGLMSNGDAKKAMRFA